MEPGDERLRQLGTQRMEQGDHAGAIEIWRQLLSRDPDDAVVHALLSLCLIATKRVHAAELEAGLALVHDASHPLSHHAMGVALIAKRKFKQAREHLDQAIRLDPTDTWSLRTLAGLERLEGREREAIELLEQALRLDPEDPGILTDRGEIDLEKGRLREADEKAKQALALSPEHQDALILAGRVLLRRGEIEDARQHALWALRANPGDEGALAFLAEVKARQSIGLGLWWRYATWMGALGSGGSIAILVGAYFLYRLGEILLDEAGNAGAAQLLTFAWLGIVAYTWFAPVFFVRMVKKELATVRLKPDF